MADFKTRIDDLTGFASTDDNALSDWLTSGARQVIDVLPMSRLDRMAETVDAQENMQIDIKEAIDRYFRKTSTCSDWKCTEK